MKGQGQEKAKFTFDTKIAIAGLCLDIYVFIQSLGNQELSWEIFSKLMTICIIIAFIIVIDCLFAIGREWKIYLKYIEKLEKRAKDNSEEQNKYGYKKSRYRKCFMNRIAKRITSRYVKKSIFIYLFVVATLCLFNPGNVYAYGEKVKDLIGIETKKEEHKEPEEAPKDGEGVAKPIVPKNGDRNLEWRFVLDNPHKSFGENTERKYRVFWGSDKLSADWMSDVEKTVQQWREEGKKGVDYRTVSDEDGNNFYTYTEREDSFKFAVEFAKPYSDYDEWSTYAPHSSECDSYIEGRERLNQIQIGDEIGCYELWWHLANDYQYYAQEYEYQTDNAEAVLHYYINSIYSCMKALEYAINKAEFDRTYHFMVMRYHDICRDECIISQEYKSRAYSIYLILKQMDLLDGTNGS